MPKDLEEPEAEKIMATLEEEDKNCREKRSVDEKIIIIIIKCSCEEKNPHRDGKREIMQIRIQCSLGWSQPCIAVST